MLRTMKRLLSAKSTSAANHYCSTVFWNSSAFATTCWPGAMPGQNLLHVAGQHVAADHFDAPELLVARRARRPSRDRADAESRWREPRRASACCWPWNVAVTNMPGRIRPGLRTSMRTLAVRMLGSRIGPMLLMRPGEDLVGIGVQADVGVLAEVHVRQIVLVDVADDPDVREIGNGERIGRARPCTPAALVTCWSVITPETGARISTMPRGLIEIGAAQHAKLLGGGFDIHLGLVFGVLRDLQIVQRDGALVVQQLARAPVACAPAARRPPPSDSRKTRRRCPRFARAAGVGLS